MTRWVSETGVDREKADVDIWNVILIRINRITNILFSLNALNNYFWLANVKLRLDSSRYFENISNDRLDWNQFWLEEMLLWRSSV